MAKAKRLPNKKWLGQVQVGGKRVSKTFDTKAEAEYFIAKQKAKGIKEPTKDTLRNAVEKYIKLSETLSPSTLDNYERMSKNSFQHIMDLPISSLTNEVMQNAINVESKRTTVKGRTITAKAVKNEWGLISSALYTLYGMRFNVRLPKVQHKNYDLPEPEEIIDAVKGTSVELPCLLAMWCGLRMSEIRGLKFTDLNGNVLSINRVIVDVDTVPTEKELAKTDSSVRKITLPDYISGLIKPLESPYIVPMTANTINHRYTRLLDKKGLKLSFHGLRHIFASVMLTKLQIPDKIVQDAGGWKTDAVMKQTYSQTFNKSRIDADNLRDNYFNSLINANKSANENKTTR